MKFLQLVLAIVISCELSAHTVERDDFSPQGPAALPHERVPRGVGKNPRGRAAARAGARKDPQVKAAAKILRAQAISLRAQAKSLLDQARSLRVEDIILPLEGCEEARSPMLQLMFSFVSFLQSAGCEIRSDNPQDIHRGIVCGGDYSLVQVIHRAYVEFKAGYDPCLIFPPSPIPLQAAGSITPT